MTVTNDPATLVTGDNGLTVTVGGLPPQHDAVTTGAIGNPLELVLGDDGTVVIVTGATSDPTRLFAAPGDDTEYKANKGIPGGYVPLDASRRMPLSMYPLGAPAGTLNSFTLNSVPAFMATVPPTVVTGSVTMVTSWTNVSAAVWLGNVSGNVTSPVFTSSPLYPSMIPSLSTGKFVSGVLDLTLMPVAVGIGHPDHASGVVPDPGATGAPDDYLARDMTYKTMQAAPSYEPVVPDPSIVILDVHEGRVEIIITDTLSDTSLFYRLDHGGTFLPVPDRPIPAAPGMTVEAYGAKIGYQNSDTVLLVIPNP